MPTRAPAPARRNFWSPSTSRAARPARGSQAAAARRTPRQRPFLSLILSLQRRPRRRHPTSITAKSLKQQSPTMPPAVRMRSSSSKSLLPLPLSRPRPLPFHLLPKFLPTEEEATRERKFLCLPAATAPPPRPSRDRSNRAIISSLSLPRRPQRPGEAAATTRTTTAAAAAPRPKCRGSAASSRSPGAR